MTDSTPTPECPHGHDSRDDCMWVGGPCYDAAYGKQIAALTAERDEWKREWEAVAEDCVAARAERDRYRGALEAVADDCRALIDGGLEHKLTRGERMCAVELGLLTPIEHPPCPHGVAWMQDCMPCQAEGMGVTPIEEQHHD